MVSNLNGQHSKMYVPPRNKLFYYLQVFLPEHVFEGKNSIFSLQLRHQMYNIELNPFFSWENIPKDLNQIVDIFYNIIDKPH